MVTPLKTTLKMRKERQILVRQRLAQHGMQELIIINKIIRRKHTDYNWDIDDNPRYYNNERGD